jgi:formylmethanofuran dehydrogenase subunit B
VTSRRSAPSTSTASARPPLSAARRVLVTGLIGGSVDAVVAACDLAESLGAAVDFGHAEMARPAGPTIARAGEVTAVRAELRDRADLVVFWFCDPAARDERFIATNVAAPPSPPLRRKTLAIGPAAVLPPSGLHRHLPADRAAAVETARMLQLMLRDGHLADAADPLGVVCTAARAAIDEAACVAIVTDDSSDTVGLEAWSVVHLVRAIAHRKPAFEVPLGAAADAAAVCTWRYGAAGAIARADRAGAECLPGEASAARLIERGEVDAVVAVGTLCHTVERAIAARGGSLSVVPVADDAPAIRAFMGQRPPAGGRP